MAENKAVLHLGLNSGALLEFEGEAADKALKAIEDTRLNLELGTLKTTLVVVCNRPGFKQTVNLAMVECIDFFPEGTEANV